MPQNKKTQAIYGIKHAAFSAVWKHLKGRESDFTKQEIFQLIEVAANGLFFSTVSGVGHIRKFGALYARDPGSVIKILAVARHELDEQALKQSGVIKQFLLTHATITVKGKPQAVSALTDGEIAKHLTRPRLSVGTESVHKERQKLSKGKN